MTIPLTAEEINQRLQARVHKRSEAEEKEQKCRPLYAVFNGTNVIVDPEKDDDDFDGVVDEKSKSNEVSPFSSETDDSDHDLEIDERRIRVTNADALTVKQKKTICHAQVEVVKYTNHTTFKPQEDEIDTDTLLYWSPLHKGIADVDSAKSWDEIKNISINLKAPVTFRIRSCGLSKQFKESVTELYVQTIDILEVVSSDTDMSEPPSPSSSAAVAPIDALNILEPPATVEQ